MVSDARLGNDAHEKRLVSLNSRGWMPDAVARRAFGPKNISSTLNAAIAISNEWQIEPASEKWDISWRWRWWYQDEKVRGGWVQILVCVSVCMRVIGVPGVLRGGIHCQA